MAPQLASAQTVVSDPALLSIAKQQLTVQQQQLAVLNQIEALQQAKATGPVAAAALAYAQQQGQKQAEVEQAQQQAQTAAAAQQYGAPAALLPVREVGARALWLPTTARLVRAGGFRRVVTATAPPVVGSPQRPG